MLGLGSHLALLARIVWKGLSHFFEAVAAPLAQAAIFVEESNRSPLSFAGHEVGATDRFSHLKYAPKILLAEYAEYLVQLLEEFRAIGAFIRRRQLTLALRKYVSGQEQGTNQEEKTEELNLASGHD